MVLGNQRSYFFVAFIDPGHAGCIQPVSGVERASQGTVRNQGAIDIPKALIRFADLP